MGACVSACPAGQVSCDGRCVSTDSDRAHCGACGNACPSGQVCAMGACAVSCPEGQTVCGARCVDLLSDRAHCGACGVSCASGEVCLAGRCQVTCPQGFTACPGGGCANLRTDPTNCGACGTLCPSGANGRVACVSGGCAAVCNAGFGDCNGDASDGCEAALTSTASCGRCGVVCGAQNAGASCAAGACVVTCNAGFGDCNGSAADGCEADLARDVMNCGACGARPPEVCDGRDNDCDGAVDEGVCGDGDSCANPLVAFEPETAYAVNLCGLRDDPTSNGCSDGTGADGVIRFRAPRTGTVSVETVETNGVMFCGIVRNNTCADGALIDCDCNSYQTNVTVSPGQDVFLHLMLTTPTCGTVRVRFRYL